MLNVYSIGEIFGEAYQMAATIKIAVEGFKATRLMPVDRHVFGDEDFLAETLVNADTLIASKKLFEISSQEILPLVVLPSPASNSRQGKSFVVTTDAHRAELEEAEINRKDREIDNARNRRLVNFQIHPMLIEVLNLRMRAYLT